MLALDSGVVPKGLGTWNPPELALSPETLVGTPHMGPLQSGQEGWTLSVVMGWGPGDTNPLPSYTPQNHIGPSPAWSLREPSPTSRTTP